MPFSIDIKEDEIKSWGHEILETLLLDRTTGENIIWATDDYASLGDSYTFFQHITPELITGEHKDVIQPRVVKSEKEKKQRTRKMAEVFTPSWLCNDMNNGVDESWFKRKPVFLQNNSTTNPSYRQPYFILQGESAAKDPFA